MRPVARHTSAIRSHQVSVGAARAARALVPILHGFGMMPAVRKVHIIGVKAVRTAGAAVKSGVLGFAGEEFGDGVHAITH